MRDINVDEAATKFDRTPVVNAWGFKSPLLAGGEFEVQLRAKVFDGMSLDGATVKIVDAKTGAVLASTRAGGPEETAAGMLQDAVTLPVPPEAGMYKYVAVLDLPGDGAGVPKQTPIAFSVVPAGEREIVIACKDDKSGKPLPARIFLYNLDLEKVRPIDVRADENGVARAKIIAGSPYRAEAVREDYVTSFLDIPAEDEVNEFELPMRFIFNVKIKRPF